MIPDLRFTRTSNMYRNKLLVPVIGPHSSALGVFPQDQGLHSCHVFLWDSFRALRAFLEPPWKLYEVTFPASAKGTLIYAQGPGVYYADYIPNTWKIMDYTSESPYTE